MALRGRDVTDTISKKGFELGVVQCLVQLAEQQSHIRQQLKELMSSQMQFIDILTEHNQAMSGLADQHEKMVKKYEPDSEANEDAERA